MAQLFQSRGDYLSYLKEFKSAEDSRVDSKRVFDSIVAIVQDPGCPVNSQLLAEIVHILGVLDARMTKELESTKAELKTVKGELAKLQNDLIIGQIASEAESKIVRFITKHCPRFDDKVYRDTLTMVWYRTAII